MTYKVARTSIGPDPHIGSVTLLLNGDGANNSTDIRDSSRTPKAITAFGDAKISTAQSKWNGSSLVFDGSGDYLSVPHSADFDLGNQDFTIEFWLWPVTSTNYWVLGKGDTTTAAGSSFSFYNGGTWDFYVGGAAVALTRPTLTTNAWQHIAVIRNSGTITIYKGGSSVSTGSIGTGAVNSTPSWALQIGSYSTSGYNGYLDDLRITKGVARYTSNFTPPTQPFPNV